LLPKQFQTSISDKLRSKNLLRPEAQIGNSTATFWLRELGMTLVVEKKMIYKDGHERPDIVERRHEYCRVLEQEHNPMVTQWGDGD
jgi:hypothetical protein